MEVPHEVAHNSRRSCSASTCLKNSHICGFYTLWNHRQQCTYWLEPKKNLQEMCNLELDVRRTVAFDDNVEKKDGEVEEMELAPAGTICAQLPGT